MKKLSQLLVLLTIFLGVFNSCEEPQIKESDLNPIVNKFVASQEYSRRESIFKEYGKIDINKTIIESVEVGNKIYNTLLIPIYQNHQITAQIQIADLMDTKILPNNEKYAINLIDYTEFREAELSGYVKMIDMNYENFEHAYIEIANNKVLNWQRTELPESLRVKYSSLNIRRDGTQDARVTNLSCDPNKDGNVGFFECYACVKDAIAQNSTSDFICDIPIAGWIGCFTSTSSACVVISAIY